MGFLIVGTSSFTKALCKAQTTLDTQRLATGTCLYLDVGEGEVDAARVGVALVAVEDHVLQLRPDPLHEPPAQPLHVRRVRRHLLSRHATCRA